jgi:hypothetical protein
MAVAVLCVGIGGYVVTAPAERVVLLRDMLGEVGRDHLLELLGCVSFDKSVVCVVSSYVHLSSMAYTAGESFVVVAL